MSASLVNQKIADAVDAQESGDFAMALAKLRSAKMYLSGKPDTKISDEELIWDREAIDQAIADMLRAKNASAGFVSVPIQDARHRCGG
ncbi:MAG: hypothetical protein AAGA03_16880 [Planctomycetota bacterium]